MTSYLLLQEKNCMQADYTGKIGLAGKGKILFFPLYSTYLDSFSSLLFQLFRIIFSKQKSYLHSLIPSFEEL